MTAQITFDESKQKSLFGNKDVVKVTFSVDGKSKAFQFTKEVAGVLKGFGILEVDSGTYKFSDWIGENDISTTFEIAAKQNMLGNSHTLDKSEALKLARMLVATNMDKALSLPPATLGAILIDYSAPAGK
ncbi:MAG: hypothetical protein AABZ14_02140 [Candidatus Margulisiibacteriota bacterium]